MFDSLPDKSDVILQKSSPAMILLVCISAAFGGGTMVGIFVGRHFGNPLSVVDGLGLLCLAVWYGRILLRGVKHRASPN